MTPSTQPYYLLIRSALEKIEEYLPATEAEFLVQSMAQDAILMRLQEIGELLTRVRRLSPDLFTLPEHDAWTKMIALRNIISHGYESVEMNRIWQIVIEELPAFSKTIHQAIELNI
ncbi:MAG TPA: HepT-like ribonuclease domain-containing protein [Thermomicrobiales bacterium]|nr:HepT-like ribonuclease domain-containing protein [Thermomicrobiales bacterium]